MTTGRVPRAYVRRMDPNPPHHIDDPEGMEELVHEEPLGGGYPELYDPDAGRPEYREWKGEEEEPKSGG